MSKPGLLLIAISTLVLTVFAVTRIGAAGQHPGTPDLEECPRITAENFLTSPAALRWRHSQPTHWRALVLQR